MHQHIKNLLQLYLLQFQYLLLKILPLILLSLFVFLIAILWLALATLLGKFVGTIACCILSVTLLVIGFTTWDYYKSVKEIDLREIQENIWNKIRQIKTGK